MGIARGWPREPAGNLSYGQRKLLELASLLVADPAVLLLDEPAGGVNPTLIKQLADRIRELNQAGKTFLVVEHNMEFVMSLCHQVTVLSQGTTLISGTPARSCGRTRRCSTPTSAARREDGEPDVRRGARPRSVRVPSATGRGAGTAPRSRRRRGAAAPLLSDQRRDRGLRRRRHPQARSRSTSPRAASPASSAPTAPASRRCWPRSAACCGRGARPGTRPSGRCVPSRKANTSGTAALRSRKCPGPEGSWVSAGAAGLACGQANQ